MKERPHIGVTGPDRGGFPAWICTRVAVARAGGKAVRLRPGRFKHGQPLPEIDGLVLGGGADVEPALYGEMPPPEPADEPPRDSPFLGRLLTWLLAPLLAVLRHLFSLSAVGMDRDRDRFEAQCLGAALADDLPVLGICRGAQFLNVRAGGTLHAELSGFYGEAGNLRSVAPRKRVNIACGTRLHSILGDAVLVNSLHRQAVDRLGEGMVCAARDESGVIQAIEHTGHAFMIGIQWHPEYLPAMRDQQRLFQELVNSARDRDGSWNVRPAPGGETRGLMFEVSAEELRRLDRYERLGIRYERVETRLADGRPVWLYRRLPRDTVAPSNAK